MDASEVISLQRAIARLQSRAINDLLVLLLKHGASDEEIAASGFNEKLNQAARINEDIERETPAYTQDGLK